MTVKRMKGRAEWQPPFEYSAPQSPDGDNFKSPVLNSSWTVGLGASDQAHMDGGGWHYAPSATAHAGSLSKSHTWANGETVIGCFAIHGLTIGENEAEITVGGALGAVGLRYEQDTSNPGQHHLLLYRFITSGSAFTILYDKAIWSGSNDHVWLGIKMTAANTYSAFVSPNGKYWTPIITGQSATITPNNISAQINCQSPGLAVGSIYYIDVRTDI